MIGTGGRLLRERRYHMVEEQHEPT
jgi:hypothetical protein